MNAPQPQLDATAEGALLVDALGDLPAHLISREPLGYGSVAGFRVQDTLPEQTYFVDTSQLGVAAETGLTMGDDPRRPQARIWLHPADPHLPALAASAFAHSSQLLLSRLGIEATGPTEFVAYRPGRRGVLRVAAVDGPVWIKVVRPRRIRRIVEAHRACAEAGLPVPEMLGWSADGLLVLADAAGAPATNAEWTPRLLVEQVARLSEAIDAVTWAAPARSIVNRLEWYETRSGPEGRMLAERIRAALTRAGETEPRVVHGDLHFGQLFLSDGRISGLIDVDTLGVGDPAEDPAAFIGHAIASARLSSAGDRQRVLALAEAAMRHWGMTGRVAEYGAIHLLGYSVTARDLGDRTAQSQLLRAAGVVLDGRGATEAKNALMKIFESV
ncbi:phosphotransferase [Microbacterium sp.]|uniref:phosphotransferase n=1 Tax=Microbacterium sp. TaxID=51671 RepID=UPI002811F448|nr:phosphotransferase [Microbacterium sp.]